MRQHKLFVSSICLLIGSSIVSASSGGGYKNDISSKPKIDRLYEEGKSYYRAKLADGTKLEYCIKGDSGLTKLSRRSVKPFKKGLSVNFINSLYSCADPNLKIADAVPANQSDAIFYYLNKRFKLKLKHNN